MAGDATTDRWAGESEPGSWAVVHPQPVREPVDFGPCGSAGGWESRERLYAYAAAPDMFHRKAWALINRKEKKSRQYVGLWHEAYVVPESGYESVYADMPAYGLAAATGPLSVESWGRRAADRFAHRSPAKSGEAG